MLYQMTVSGFFKHLITGKVDEVPGTKENREAANAGKELIDFRNENFPDGGQILRVLFEEKLEAARAANRPTQGATKTDIQERNREEPERDKQLRVINQQLNPGEPDKDSRQSSGSAHTILQKIE